MSNSHIQKCRKTNADDDLSSLCLTQLPTTIFNDVIKYLPKPSVALLAVALTSPSSSWREINWKKSSPIFSWATVTSNNPRKRNPSAATEAILVYAQMLDSKYWHSLDFEEIELSLAAKLSDDDLAAALVCIDCKRWLRKLKLAGLVNISGSGLEPLRYSIQLQQVDFSLLGEHEKPENEKGSALSKGAVLPLLCSIISTNGNSLKFLQFPRSWLVNEDGEVDRLLLMYRHLLDSREINCKECSRIIGRSDDPLAIDPTGPREDNCLSQFSCYNCLRSNCDSCNMALCYTCKKFYCTDCWLHIPAVRKCENAGGCEQRSCNACRIFRECVGCDEMCCCDCSAYCDLCEKAHCTPCFQRGDPIFYYCQNDECYNCNCSTCVNSTNVSRCDTCGKKFCLDCRLKNYENNLDPQYQIVGHEYEVCAGCAKIIVPELFARNEWFRTGVNSLISRMNHDARHNPWENQEQWSFNNS